MIDTEDNPLAHTGPRTLEGVHGPCDTRGMTAAPWRFRWIGLAYLIVVIGVAVFVYLTSFGFLVEPGNPSFAGIWLLLATFPASQLFLAADPQVTDLPAFGLLVALGLAQAAAVFLLCWWFDRLLSSARSDPDPGQRT